MTNQVKFLFIMIIVCLINSCQSNNQVDFNTQIKPIINKKCISCHGGVKKTAGFSFLFKEQALGNTDEGSPAIIPGNSSKSRLIKRLHETDLELRMPFEKPALSKDEISLFTKWIDQGAKWGTHWAYIPPKKSKLPKARSDHYNFAKKNIPIIFYFNGTHDDYHKPTDTPDKINYSILTKRSKLIFYTTWKLANQKNRIRLKK